MLTHVDGMGPMLNRVARRRGDISRIRFAIATAPILKNFVQGEAILWWTESAQRTVAAGRCLSHGTCWCTCCAKTTCS